MTDPLTFTTVTNLDGQGRKTDYTDKRGIETTYNYDKYGRVKNAFFNANNKSPDLYPPEQVQMPEAGFDALDRPGQISDTLLGNTETFTYDSLDSILSATDNVGIVPVVSYTYDSNGRRITMTPSWEAAFNYGYDCADELVGISNNGTWTPSNCSPSTFVNYTGNISNSAQVAFNLDKDGNATEMLVDGVDTKITSHDADERVKAESFQPYASPSPSYGSLTYTYDADGHLIDKGGSLAATNFPAAVPTTSYTATYQVLSWNGHPSARDNASNLTSDPASGLAPLIWSARNQLSGITGVTSEQYDGLGRRESSAGGGSTLDFEYDGSTMIGWNTSGSSPSYNFLTVPGGGALAGSFTSGGTTTTWVPLIDASGSTIGLVNAASPQSGPVTTYTYDPSGNPTVTGTPNDWPFQYKGMEKEFTDPGPYYYTGSGQFYNPQMVRSLSEVGETGTSGPGSGPAGNAIALPSGGGGNGSFGHWYVNNVLDPSSTGNQLGNLPDIGFVFSSETTGYFIPVGEIAQIIDEWVSFFEWLLGGSDTPMIPRQLLHGRHPLYFRILGLRFLIVTEYSAAPASGNIPGTGVLLAQDVVPWVQPFTDLDPFNFEEGEPPPLPFGLEPKKENACREAAKLSEDDWARFCSSLYQRKWGNQLYAKCMSYLLESTQQRLGFCGWLEIPYYNPLQA